MGIGICTDCNVLLMDVFTTFLMSCVHRAMQVYHTNSDVYAHVLSCLFDSAVLCCVMDACFNVSGRLNAQCGIDAGIPGDAEDQAVGDSHCKQEFHKGSLSSLFGIGRHGNQKARITN